MEDTYSPPLCRFEELARREDVFRRRQKELQLGAQNSQKPASEEPPSERRLEQLSLAEVSTQDGPHPPSRPRQWRVMRIAAV